MTPFDPDVARAAAADLAYPDEKHGTKTGRAWGNAIPVAVRGVANEVDMSWQDGTAACIGHPVDWWFPDDKKNATVAKEICATCPLIDPCRAHGIKHEQHGVWGGLTIRERQAIRKGRSGFAGRPLSPITHGTRAGYEKHRRHPDIYGPTSQCEPCRTANHMATRSQVRAGVTDWVQRDHPMVGGVA